MLFSFLRFRWWVLGLIGALSVFLSLQIGSLHVKVDAESILPQAHPFVTATNKMERLFGGKNQVLIGVLPRSGTVYQTSVLSVLQKTLAGELLGVFNANRTDFFVRPMLSYALTDVWKVYVGG